MKSTMKHFVKERFKESFNKLSENNYFKNKKAFAESMDITPQFLSQLLNDNTPVPLEFISSYIEVYPINPGYLFNRNDHTVFTANAKHLQNKATSFNNSFQGQSFNQSSNFSNSLSSDVSVDDLASLLYKVSQMQIEVARIFERATANLANR